MFWHCPWRRKEGLIWWRTFLWEILPVHFTTFHLLAEFLIQPIDLSSENQIKSKSSCWAFNQRTLNFCLMQSKHENWVFEYLIWHGVGVGVLFSPLSFSSSLLSSQWKQQTPTTATKITIPVMNTIISTRRRPRWKKSIPEAVVMPIFVYNFGCLSTEKLLVEMKIFWISNSQMRGQNHSVSYTASLDYGRILTYKQKEQV